MAKAQFLVRNRHQNIWYARIVIPQSVRRHFHGQREIRCSLKTADVKQAKGRALRFWVECQDGFKALQMAPHRAPRFAAGTEFRAWLKARGAMVKKRSEEEIIRSRHGDDIAHIIETTDVFGRTHRIDLDNPEGELQAALALQRNAAELLKHYEDNPAVLELLVQINNKLSGQTPSTPSQTKPFSGVVSAYINKLEIQGRRGKRLSERTLQNYQGRLEFWQDHFGERNIHEITPHELSDVQLWLARLPVNFAKQGLTTAQAVRQAKDLDSDHAIISDKTRAEYLGQLKGVLEYAYDCGFIEQKLSDRIEVPNTKQSRSIERLPFSTEDFRKIFPGSDYGVDFGVNRGGLDQDTKFWFPLLAAFSGARLEELGQLTVKDIHTCPDTGIVYMNIDDRGTAADGAKKRTKTKSSVRPIPLHTTLLEIGFLDFVAQRRKDKQDTSLFKLKRNKQGRLAKTVSHWFSRLDKRGNGHIRPNSIRQLKTPHSRRSLPLVGSALYAFRNLPNGFEHYRGRPDALSATLNKYLRTHDLLPTKQHCVYSLRHSFEDRLTAVEPPEKIQAMLMGHKYERERYGDGPTLEQKKNWLEKICFDVTSD